MFKTYLEDIYLEDKGYLTSQFTIGFELEGFIADEDEHVVDAYWEYAKKYFTDKGYNMFKQHMGSDCTVDARNSKWEDNTFEMQSPVFPVTPKAMQDIIKFLSKSQTEYNVRTNDTCGFHVHIGFPQKESDREDRLWTLLQILFSKHNDLSLFTQFKGFDFLNEEWSTLQYMDSIKNIFTVMAKAILQGADKSQEFTNAYNSLFTGKASVLLLHHQGTLEWRGPRSFLDTQRYEHIRDFFLHIPKVIKTLSDMIDNKDLVIPTNVGNFTLKRSEFDLMLPKFGYKSPKAERTTRKRSNKKDYRFDWQHQDPSLIAEFIQKHKWMKGAKYKDLRIDKNDKATDGRIDNANNISDCEFELLDFENCSFTSNVKIEQSILHDCTIQRGEVDNQLRSCQLNNTNIKMAELDDCTITGVKVIVDYALSNSNTYKFLAIKNGNFNKDMFRQCHIFDGTFSYCHFTDCIIEPHVHIDPTSNKITNTRKPSDNPLKEN